MTKEDLRLTHFLTEKEVCDYFGLKKKALGILRREKDLPYVRISATQRVYFENDLIDWLLERRFKGGLEMGAYTLREAS